MAHDSLVLADPAYLRHYPGARFARREGVTLVASPLEGPGFNYATCLGASRDLASLLVVADEFFGDKPGGWGVLVEGGAGSALEAELQAAGYEVAEDEPAFVMPSIARGPRPAAPELQLRVARDRPTLADFRAVTVAAFGAPPEMAEQFTPDSMCDDGALAFVVGYRAGEPVSGAMMALAAGSATIAGVATLPEHRGRGFGAAATWAAIDEGVARGAHYASLRSGPLSVPLYERLGFQYVCQHTTYVAPTA
jgi:GNAT superfamily N-acetyltransferase